MNVSTFLVDCVWGEYGNWSTCTKSCGGGEKTRSRQKAKEASNGGKKCQGTASEMDTCNKDPCPVDCVWGEYGEWTTCTKSCGGGEKTRSRPKATEASNGGKECQGESTKTVICNQNRCPGN